MLPGPHSGDSGRGEVLFEEPPLPGPLSGDLGRRGVLLRVRGKPQLSRPMS